MLVSAQQQSSEQLRYRQQQQQQQQQQVRLLPSSSNTGDQQGDDDEDENYHQQQQQQLQQTFTVCPHVAEEGAPHSAMGMCSDCFKHFLKTSGGVWGVAADPPAFKPSQQAITYGEGEDLEILLLPAPPGHGTEEEIQAELQAETRAAAAAAGGKTAAGSSC